MPEDSDLIRRGDDVRKWETLLHFLGEAGVHLQQLLNQMEADGEIDEIDFGVQLAGVYGHLNQSWNGRSLSGESLDEWWTDEMRRFPDDIMCNWM